MPYNDFNLDNFDENIAAFDLILRLLKDEEADQKDQSLIQNLIINLNNRGKNYQSFLKMISKDSEDSYTIFCFLLLLKNLHSKSEFLNEFLSYVKQEFKSSNNTNLEIKKVYTEDELKDLNVNNILYDLNRIFNNNTELDNYISIQIKDGHLTVQKQSLDEIMQIIYQDEPNQIVKKGKKKKKNKK